MTDAIPPDRLAQFQAHVAEQYQLNDKDVELIIQNALHYDETGKTLVFILAALKQGASADVIKKALAFTRISASQRDMDDFFRRSKS